MGDAKRDEAAMRRLSAPTLERGVGAHARPEAPAPAGAGSPFDPVDHRFEVRGELGRGGMGWVEDAFDRALGRGVAIKHMLGGSALDLARFEREARITARLEHPGIVPVHEAGRGPDGTPYYVMRRVDGRPLAELVAEASLADRLALVPNVVAACDAVAFAHARGVVHRDLKPGNILVGPFGETLVIDWGLAREIGPEAPAGDEALAAFGGAVAGTVAGAVAGTPGFMAPEQARGEPIDARADVFALGATLFYVLAGTPLYDGASPTEMVSLAGAGRSPDWRALPARVPADLRAILGKALAGDPARRYGDAGMLAADLRRFVTGNLVDAHRYGAAARLARFVRRHRAAVAVTAASAIVLAIVATLALRRVVAERDDANAARALAEARQRQATDAADQLLVQRAQQLAATDPVGAITLLRRLDAGSSRWRDAWLAATAAWSHGIPFGVRADHKLFWVQISADNRHAVATSLGSGRVVVHDLVGRTHRTVATLAGARMCLWIGDHHLLCSDAGRLAIVDTERATTRALELRATDMVGDRRSRVVVETPDHRVVEVTGPDGQARELARDVTLAAATPDLGALALWRGDALELWTPSGTLPIAQVADRHQRARATVELRDDTIAAMIGDEVRRWRVQGGRVVDDGRWPRHDDNSVTIAAGHLYSVADVELRTIDAPIRNASIRPMSVFPTARGLCVLESDGGIALLDGDGWLRIGPYPTRFERVDLSLDGRFLIAVTDLDELLAWDLGALRPRAVYVAAAEQPLKLTPPYLWTLDPMRGLVRHTLGDDAGTVVLRGVAALGDPWSTIADDGRWAALRDPRRDVLAAYDATRDTRGALGQAVTQAVDGDGLVIAAADGTLARWTPGHDQLTPIGRLPGAPSAFSITDRFVVAQLAPGRLSRFDLASHQRGDAELRDPVHDVAITREGRAWIATEHGELWRWEPTAPPVRVERSEPVDRLVITGGRILAHTSRALVALDREPPRAVQVDARATSWMGADYVASVGPRGVVSVIDLETGGSVTLRATAVTGGVVASGDRLLFATTIVGMRARLEDLELRVPHDAAALQRWLREITNATPPDGGQGGGWP